MGIEVLLDYYMPTDTTRAAKSARGLNNVFISA
uniref:Uncharacterized protein n=1 Tax=Microviridae sp. ctMqy3 TaxID=2824995 RepID=A0A8S5VF56_9VIRU|nr:MAG TPA: hypothetical protein [Microviridae sp. ctMqy3]